MKRFLFVSLALIGMMATAPSAHANSLAPGGSTTDDSFTYGGGGVPGLDPIGSPLATLTGQINDQSTGNPIASWTEWVYRNSNGTLDFLYQLTNDSASTTIETVPLRLYAGFTTDVGVLSNPTALTPAGVAGTIHDTSIERDLDGGAVNFEYSTSGFTTGKISDVLVVATNALNYGPGNVGATDGLTGESPSFGPSTVPEPSSLALAGLGALGMIGYGLRRRKALGA